VSNHKQLPDQWMSYKNGKLRTDFTSKSSQVKAPDAFVSPLHQLSEISGYDESRRVLLPEEFICNRP
jgi:hypothetical protein